MMGILSPDINVARDFLAYELEEGEMVLADGVYSDDGQYFITPTGMNEYVDKMMADARARHKTVNKLFKDNNILKNMCIEACLGFIIRYLRWSSSLCRCGSKMMK